MQMKKIRKAI